MNNRKYKVLAVGSGDPGKPPIAVGYIKTYVENVSSMAGKVIVTILCPSTQRSFKGIEDGIKAANPDMITFTPHEDWDLSSMLGLCKNLKKWNSQIPIVVCAENPRNRLEAAAAAESRAIDYVIHGEPELPLEAIIGHYAAGNSLPENTPGILCLIKAKKKPAALKH